MMIATSMQLRTSQTTSWTSGRNTLTRWYDELANLIKEVVVFTNELKYNDSLFDRLLTWEIRQANDNDEFVMPHYFPMAYVDDLSIFGIVKEVLFERNQ